MSAAHGHIARPLSGAERDWTPRLVGRMITRMPGDLPTGTVTFLFTDVEGSTQLLRSRGAEHRRVIREACAAEGGVEVDTQGDAFFFASPTAPGALAAAAVLTESLAPGLTSVRVGVHTGTPLVTEEGVRRMTLDEAVALSLRQREPDA